MAVLANVLLHDTSGVRGTLTGNVLQLVGLGADDILDVGNLLINDFAVADVHERSEVGHSHGNDEQTPEGDESDKPVARESSSEGLETPSETSYYSFHHAHHKITYGSSVDDILSEQNALKLDQEEIQQLGKVLQDSLMGLLGDGVIAARAERAGNALLEDDLTCDLNGSGNYNNGSVCLPPTGHATNSQPSDMYRNLKAQRRRGR